MLLNLESAIMMHVNFCIKAENFICRCSTGVDLPIPLFWTVIMRNFARGRVLYPEIMCGARN